MSKETDEFFEGKRPWSKIKDRILENYLTAYLAKLNIKRNPIVLIDAFAGPGQFEDGTEGSPLLMCRAAEKFAANYHGIFINKERKHHDRLDTVLHERGWHPVAEARLGDSNVELPKIADTLTTQTVFLYLDPFGLECNFSTLEPFLSRNPAYSTEIVMNLSAMGIHRMAGRNKTLDGTLDPGLQKDRSERLTDVLGGDYWKDALLTPGLETKDREQMIVTGYMERLAANGYLRYTGACPIQPTRDGATKYHMIFASRHPDARMLFNDEMLKAFEKFMNQQEMEDTLFADLSWLDWRDRKELEKIVVSYVTKHPGHTRLNLWKHLILNDHFMRFTESEYKKAVTAVFEAKMIQTPTQRPTKKLNDGCVLFPT